MSLSSGPTSRITSGAPDLASPRGLAHAELDPRGSCVSGHPHADLMMRSLLSIGATAGEIARLIKKADAAWRRRSATGHLP